MSERNPLVCTVTEKGSLVPSDFESAYRFSQVIAASQLSPKDFDTAERVFVAVQLGLELGLPPMQAIQNIAVINGRPTVWGNAALGICRSTGLLEDIDEHAEGKPYEDDFAWVCTITRRGQATPVERRFSVADAKRAGLWAKRGYQNKPTPWVLYPDRMLQMRARGFALRDAFSDALCGLNIAEEFQGHEDDMKVEVVQRPELTIEALNRAMRARDDESASGSTLLLLTATATTSP